MTPRESMTAFCGWKTWQRARSVTGVLAISAGIATTVAGIFALSNERDTSSAMKLPVALAFICIWAFIHAQKKILAMRKPNQVLAVAPP